MVLFGRALFETLRLLRPENDRLGISASGALLAERAVTDRRQHRGADGSIANIAAHATAFVDITHGLLSSTWPMSGFCEIKGIASRSWSWRVL